MNENNHITHLNINGQIYKVVGDQSDIHNLAFYFNEDTQGITSLVIPVGSEDYSAIKPTAATRAFACGMGCKANVVGSIAMGKNCTTQGSGQAAIALGYGASAEGDGAIALGHLVTAKSVGAVALGGAYTESLGIGSLAVGNMAIAQNDYAIALGRSAYAKGQYSVAIGSSIVATHDHSTVIGKLNKEENSNVLFSIGNGFWYHPNDKIILEQVPQLTQAQIKELEEKYEQDMRDAEKATSDAIGALDPNSETYQQDMADLGTALVDTLNKLQQELESLRINQNLNYSSQPGCALQVYADGSAIWSSRRSIANNSYTTTQYIVQNENTDLELDTFKGLIIDPLNSNTFDITAMGKNGLGKIIKAFGAKDAFFAQVYQNNNVSFYRYINGEYTLLSLNNIDFERR